MLLDAICQATGVPEKFNGWPEGYRAIQVWDNRMPSYFFRIFGRPMRASVCECERSNEPSITQALHLMNSAEIAEQAPLAHGHRPAAGRLREDARRRSSTNCTWRPLARFPSGEERALMLAAFAAPGPTAGRPSEDVLWTLLNPRSSCTTINAC